jgi:REP element-mobilizing transposase RayT
VEQDTPTWIEYNDDLTIRNGTFLPHWEVADGIYFVTFRLADSLSSVMVNQLVQELSKRNLTGNPKSRGKHLREFFLDRVDKKLDQHSGECHLQDDWIAEQMQGALQYFDGKRYRLFAWSIMPNHVHVVFQKEPDWKLAEIIHSWKSYVAHQVRGSVEMPLWRPDYFEHLIRTVEQLERICSYVIHNPDVAGLNDWPWVGTPSG